MELFSGGRGWHGRAGREIDSLFAGIMLTRSVGLLGNCKLAEVLPLSECFKRRLKVSELVDIYLLPKSRKARKDCTSPDSAIKPFLLSPVLC